jgi:hypothetical protein
VGAIRLPAPVPLRLPLTVEREKVISTERRLAGGELIHGLEMTLDTGLVDAEDAQEISRTVLTYLKFEMPS